MQRNVYVGLDVHADTIAVATAEIGRSGEVWFQSVIENSANSVLRLTNRLAAMSVQLNALQPSEKAVDNRNRQRSDCSSYQTIVGKDEANKAFHPFAIKIIMLLALMGCLLSEISALRWQEFDVDQK